MQRHRVQLACAALIVVATAGWLGGYYQSAGGAMSQAADKFLGALSSEQLAKTRLAFDDPKRLDWHFIPKPERKGLQVKEMTEAQRKAAHGLLHAGLSEVGYDKTVAIMGLEAILHELEKNRKGGPIRDPERYYFTIFGEPKPNGKWGWSVEGHHLSLNFVVDKGKIISATPAFFGANPAIVKTDLPFGAKKGTQTLAKEENLAFKLLGTLTADQRRAAIQSDKAPADLRGAGAPQAPRDAAVGVKADSLTKEQREVLSSLLESYARNMPKEVGDAWLAEINKAGVEKVQFAWWGAAEPGVGHYYVVQGPTFVVEFVNTQGDSLNNPANHIHSVWRSLAGDFGLSI